jgi:hypothetical protein
MHCFSRPIVALTGTPDWKPLSPICDNLKNVKALVRFIVACLIISEKRRNHTSFVSTYLEWYRHCLSLKCNEDRVFCQSMRVFVGNQTPTDEMIIQKLNFLIKNYIASKPPNYELGVVIHDNFGDKIGNANFHTDHPNWNSTFQHVWERMFPSERNGVQVHDSFYVLMNSSVRNQALSVSSPAAIVTQTAVINHQPFVPAPLTHSLYALVQSNRKPVVPAFVPIPQQSASPPGDEPVRIVRVLPNPPPRDDATVLFLPVVKSVLADCVAKVIVKSAEAIGARNQAVLSRIFGEDPDANALKEEVAIQATNDESAAITSASASLEVVGLVYAAAAAGESVFQDPPPNLNPLARSIDPEIMPSSLVQIHTIPVDSTHNYFPPASSETSSSKTVTHCDDAEEAAFLAATSSPIPPLPGQHLTAPQFHANGAGGPLSVIPERTEDGADQSGNTSPHSPDGRRRAPFTTSALSPQQCVEDTALGAQPKSFKSNLGSIPPSGQSGTPQTHESADLLANLAISSKSLFIPPNNQIVHSSEWTGIGVSPQAQSSDKSSENVTYPPPLPNLFANLDPLLPTQSSSSRGHDIGFGGAHSLDIPSKSELFHVGVSGNPRADQPSFPPQGDVGGPPVQMLASSGNPPGNSGGADHTKSPLSFELGSSCIHGGKTESSTQCQNPQPSGWWHGIFQRGKNRVNPSQDATGDTRPQVTHSSDNPSESAAANSPLSQTVVLPAGRIGIDGSGSSQDGTDLSASLPPPNLFGTNGKPVRPLPPTPVVLPTGRTGIGSSPRAHSPGNLSGFVLPPSAPSSSSKLGSAATPAAHPLNEKPPTSWGVKISGIKHSGNMMDLSMVILLSAHHLLHLGVPLAEAPLFSHIPPTLLAQAVEVA